MCMVNYIDKGRIKCKTFCQESRFPLAYCLRLRLELQNLKMTMTYSFRPIIVQPFSSNSNRISFDLFMKNIWLDFSVKICIVRSLCEHLDLFDKTVGLPTNVHDRIKVMVPSTKCISNFYCCYFLFSLLLSQSNVVFPSFASIIAYISKVQRATFGLTRKALRVVYEMDTFIFH